MDIKLERRFMQSLYRDVAQVPSFLLAHYAELGLSDADMLNLARLLACQAAGSDELAPELLRRHFAGRDDELAAFLARLEQKGLVTRDEFTGGCRLDGLYQHLLELWVFNNSVPTQDAPGGVDEAKNDEKNTEAIKNVYALFEAEFARPLSPMELQKLNAWLINDGWSAVMLAEAVSRAVMHGALSLAYIDKILLRWQRAGITTPEKLAAEEPLREKRPVKRQARGKVQGKTQEPSFAGNTDYSKYI